MIRHFDCEPPIHASVIGPHHAFGPSPAIPKAPSTPSTTYISPTGRVGAQVTQDRRDLAVIPQLNELQALCQAMKERQKHVFTVSASLDVRRFIPLIVTLARQGVIVRVHKTRTQVTVLCSS